MYEKYIVVSTAECESSVYSGNRLSGCPDSFTVWRAGGTLETSLLLCAVCFSLHLFWLHSTWIIMHYPPVCTPAQVIREYMSGEEKRRQGFNYYCNYCTSGVTNWSISYGKWKEKIKEGRKERVKRDMNQLKVFSFHHLSLHPRWGLERRDVKLGHRMLSHSRLCSMTHR